jgi:hypothetical protein
MLLLFVFFSLKTVEKPVSHKYEGKNATAQYVSDSTRSITSNAYPKYLMHLCLYSISRVLSVIRSMSSSSSNGGRLMSDGFAN